MVYSWQRLRLQQDSSCDRWSWLFLQEWTACHWFAARQLGVEEKMGWMVIPHKDNFLYTEINIKYMIWRHSIFIIKLRGLEPHLRAWSARCLQSGTSMEKKHDAKTHKKKHIQTHQNTTFDQHVTCWSTFETHIRKIGKTKAIFSSALIAKLLSALAACNSQNRWNYLTAGSFTKYYPQHSPKLFSAPFPSSCCKQALFNHFFLSYLSVFFLCLAASSNFQFRCRLSSKFLPDRSRRSHLNAPTKKLHQLPGFCWIPQRWTTHQ